MKKGFTLIEILAVIAVLMIILVVVVPIISNSIQDNKEYAFFVTGKNILREVEYRDIDYDSFAQTSLRTLDISGLSEADYDFDASYVKYSATEDTLEIKLIGIGQYEGINICSMTSNSNQSVVTNEICP